MCVNVFVCCVHTWLRPPKVARAASEEPHLCGPPLNHSGLEESFTRNKDISGLGPRRELPFRRRKLMAPKAYRGPTIPSPALSSFHTRGTQASLGFPKNAGPTRHRALPPALSRVGPALCPWWGEHSPSLRPWPDRPPPQRSLPSLPHLPQPPALGRPPMSLSS